MPRKLLIVASSYLPNVGGLQAIASGLAVALLRRGYSVNVITARVPRRLPSREHIDGVPVARWTFLVPRLAYLRRGRVDLWLAGLFAFPVSLVRLLRHLARAQPDVANLQFAGSPSLCVLFAHWLRPFPLVVSLHGHDVEGLPLHSSLDRATLRAVLRRAGAVTACSRYLAGQAVLLVPEAAGRIRVNYHGLPLYPNVAAAPPGAPFPAPGSLTSPSASETASSSILPAAPLVTSSMLFAAGRLVPKKGFDVLLHALAQCANRSLRLTLCGDGAERAALRGCPRAR